MALAHRHANKFCPVGDWFAFVGTKNRLRSISQKYTATGPFSLWTVENIL